MRLWMRQIGLVCLAAAMMLTGAAACSSTQANADDDEVLVIRDRDWERLGTVTFDEDEGREVKRVLVDFDDQAYTHLKLQASDDDVRVRDVTIAFTDGDDQVVSLDRTLRDDDEGQVIDLRGNSRRIDRVYLEGSALDDDAKVTVYGLTRR